VSKLTGASPLATGLAGADAPEPPSRLGPPDGIPSAACACGRTEALKRDHQSIRLIKREAREVPEALAYIEELEALWAYAKRQSDVWRGIASAMGYEPNAHASVRPTSGWLLARIARYRAASGMEARQGGSEAPSRSDDSPTAESGDAQDA
jgi:hypothetical protein